MLLLNWAIDYELRGRIKLPKAHYIASLIGPVSIQIVFLIFKQPFEQILSGKFRPVPQFFIIFLVIGYFFGWIEIVFYKIAILLLQFIYRKLMGSSFYNR